VSPRASPKRPVHLRFRLLAAARRFASFRVVSRRFSFSCGLDAACLAPGPTGGSCMVEVAVRLYRGLAKS